MKIRKKKRLRLVLVRISLCYDIYKYVYYPLMHSDNIRRLSTTSDGFDFEFIIQPDDVLNLDLFRNTHQFRVRITASPLEGIPGTRKTERRRSRSRSRQRIESELFKIITDIPAVNDTYEYLLSAYTLIKVFVYYLSIYIFLTSTLKFFFQDSNPLFKESFERGEEMAYWMKDKTDRALSLTGLDQPLKQMDAKAAQSWEEAENMRRRVSDFYILLLLLYNNFLLWKFDEK